MQNLVSSTHKLRSLSQSENFVDFAAEQETSSSTAAIAKRVKDVRAASLCMGLVLGIHSFLFILCNSFYVPVLVPVRASPVPLV